jgi:hypothetical protein
VAHEQGTLQSVLSYPSIEWLGERGLDGEGEGILRVKACAGRVGADHGWGRHPAGMP